MTEKPEAEMPSPKQAPAQPLNVATKDLPKDRGAPQGGRGWTKLALAVSLALNLGVAGVLVGGHLGADHERAGRRITSQNPMTDAMTRDDWRGLRAANETALRQLRHGSAAMDEDYPPLLEALRAEPYDPAAVTAAAQQISASRSARLLRLSAMIGDYLAAMPTEERISYAARLEQALARGKAGDTPKKTGQ